MIQGLLESLHLWPIHTGRSAFDFWSLSHIAFWFVAATSIAATVDQKEGLFKYYFPTISSVFTSIMWEYFERIAEASWPHIWQSPESGINQVMDVVVCPLALFLGWWGYAKWRPK